MEKSAIGAAWIRGQVALATGGPLILWQQLKVRDILQQEPGFVNSLNIALRLGTRIPLTQSAKCMQRIKSPIGIAI